MSIFLHTEYVIWAIAIGMVIRNVIVLMGVRLAIQSVAKIGATGLSLVLVEIAVSVLVVLFYRRQGRGLHLRHRHHPHLWSGDGDARDQVAHGNGRWLVAIARRLNYQDKRLLGADASSIF